MYNRSLVVVFEYQMVTHEWIKDLVVTFLISPYPRLACYRYCVSCIFTQTLLASFAKYEGFQYLALGLHDVHQYCGAWAGKHMSQWTHVSL